MWLFPVCTDLPHCRMPRCRSASGDLHCCTACSRLLRTRLKPAHRGSGTGGYVSVASPVAMRAYHATPAAVPFFDFGLYCGQYLRPSFSLQFIGNPVLPLAPMTRNEDSPHLTKLFYPAPCFRFIFNFVLLIGLAKVCALYVTGTTSY